MTVGRQMTKNPIAAELGTPVTDARRIMQRQKIHRLPVEDRKGRLADIAAAIRDKGGDIISFGTFLGDDQTNALCTIKVQNITSKELVSCLEPYVEEVRDLREV